MHPKLDLFEEFEAVTREEWVADVKRYLKEKPLESLEWNIGSEIAVKPYPTAQQVQPLNLPNTTTQNDWKIVDRVVVEDIALANKTALKALNWGAESLQLEFLAMPTAKDLELLLKGIELSMVDLVFVGEILQKQAMEFLQLLKQVTAGQSLKGAIELGAQQSLECILFIKDYIPNISIIVIQLKEEGDLVQNIVSLLQQASTCLDALLAKGCEIDELSKYFRLKIEVGDNYFVELSKIRAIKRLWLGLLEAYGAKEAAFPHIVVLTKSAATDNQYQNMITATTQTMAAAIAGANSILVTPSTNWKEGDDFSLRIARNVQHLLKLESYLDRVVDPATGSYYIENISQQIAQKVWTKFQNLV